MIRRILPILLLISVAHASQSQNTVTVNNTPGSAATYRTLQGALDSVSAGTIILVQPGNGTYGQVTVNKLVSIIGAGYFLGLNPAPSTQANPGESIADQVTFAAGSNGSMLSGISFNSENNPYPFQRISINGTSDITMTRCNIFRQGGGYFIRANACNNIVFKQCYFYHSSANITTMYSTGSNNFSFYNCIFDGVGDNVGNVSDNLSTMLLFKNCSFKNYAGNGPTLPLNITYINNIIFNTTTPGRLFVCTACVNNIGNVTYSTGTNNITNAVPENTFVFGTDPEIISPDGRFKLKPGSAAIHYGEDGTDAGAFGGKEPYQLSGIPFIPNIYLAEVLGPATTNGLKIRLKVKANN